MGVRNLNRCLKRRCSTSSIRAVKLDELRDKTIAVDISIYLYKFEQFNSLLENIYVMLALFEKYGIRPCFVFDGKPPPEKQDILNARKQEREQAYQNYAELSQQLHTMEGGDSSGDIANDSEYDGDLIFPMDPEPEPESELDPVIENDVVTQEEDIDVLAKKQTILSDMEKLKKQMVRITKTKVDAVKSLLTAYGASYITADGEADELCAALVVYGKAWACISEDMDLFVYGCPRVLRYFSLVHQSAVLYDLALILNDMQMTHTEFREICILAGTDYSVALPSTVDASANTNTLNVSIGSTTTLEPEPEPEVTDPERDDADTFPILMRLFKQYATEMEHTTNSVVRQIPLAFSHWLHSNHLYRFDISAAKKVYDLFHVKWTETLNQTIIPDIAFRNNAAKIMDIMASQRFLFYEYTSTSSPDTTLLSTSPTSTTITGDVENRYLSFSGNVSSMIGISNSNKITRPHFPTPWTTIAMAGGGSSNTANEGSACQLSQLLKKSKKERNTPAPERYTVKASKPAKYRTPTYTKTIPANSPW